MATVALIGSKGSLGYKVLPELIASDAIKKIYCLSRKSSTSDNAKVEYFQVDYKRPGTVEKALKGCDVLINTMGTEGNYEESKHALVDAAAKVGVKFYIPRYFVTGFYADFSQFGVDPHVESDAVNHPCWNGKKEDDIDARKKGLFVIPIMYYPLRPQLI
jgi:saccharopine dehydrogenase-like NADP-dependent oxidoreductase